jgi:predicted nucleotidyltransferase
MAYYQANTNSPIFPELTGLMIKTAGLVDVLAAALKPLAKKLETVFVFGSIASGSERGESDIDLLVIGDVSPADLALPLRKAKETLGRDVNPAVYTLAEFDRKRAAKDHFLTRILHKPTLYVMGKNVVGKNDELESAAQ